MKFKGSVTGFKRVAVCLGAGVLVLNMYRMPAIRPERFELKRSTVSFENNKGMKKSLKPKNNGMNNYYYSQRGTVRHN